MKLLKKNDVNSVSDMQGGSQYIELKGQIMEHNVHDHLIFQVKGKHTEMLSRRKKYWNNL